MNSIIKKLFLLILVIIINLNVIYSRDALIIVGGFFGNNKHTIEKVTKYYNTHYKYDTISFNYMNRKSFDKSYQNLINEINKIDLSKYDKVNFFGFIYGGKILLKYFSENKIDNLGAVIFDRGPIEEALATVPRENWGEWILVLFGGRGLLEFSYHTFNHIPQNLQNTNIGLIIETKAIPLAYLFRRGIKKYNPSFSVDKISDYYTDYFYLNLSHKQMYKKLDLYAPSVDYFIKHGKFPEKLNRTEKDYLSEF